MSKKMCEIVKKKLHKEKPDKYRDLVKNAEFFCKECGLVSNKKSHLCKPEIM